VAAFALIPLNYGSRLFLHLIHHRIKSTIPADACCEPFNHIGWGEKDGSNQGSKQNNQEKIKAPIEHITMAWEKPFEKWDRTFKSSAHGKYMGRCNSKQRAEIIEDWQKIRTAHPREYHCHLSDLLPLPGSVIGIFRVDSLLTGP
jgi:hypothetical protein